MCSDYRQAYVNSQSPVFSHIHNEEGFSRSCAPLPSNRGVQNTSSDFIHSEGVILDWCSFTLPYESDDVFDVVQLVFGEMEYRERGQIGYSHSATILGSGSVCWSPNRHGQGVHIILPASALALLEDCESIELLGFIRDMGGKARRIDLALDDFFGDLNLDLIVEHLASGAVTTRWKSYDDRGGKCLIGSDEPVGRTVYLGERVSESYLRFYDKRLEQEAKGKEVGQEHWVRCELETKGDRAEMLTNALLEANESGGLAQFFSEYLLGLLDFKEFGASGKNKSRWETVGWWARFLLVATKKRLTKPKAVRTLESLKDWFDVAVAPSASVILSCLMGDGQAGYDWLMASIVKGSKRLRPHHRQILQEQGVT